MDIDILTIEAHHNASIQSVTDSLSGTDIDNILDGFLSTYWSPPDTAGDTIEIDCGVTPTAIDAIGFWGITYTAGTATMEVAITQSDTATTGYGSNIVAVGNKYPWQTTRFGIIPTTSQITKRYIKLALSGYSEVPGIGQIFLLRKRALDLGPQFPYNEDPEYLNSGYNTPQGGQIIAPEALNPVTRYNRKYLLNGSTPISALQGIFNACQGRRYWFVLDNSPTDGALLSDGVLCRFDQDKLDWKYKAYQFAEVALKFSSVPTIDTDENY